MDTITKECVPYVDFSYQLNNIKRTLLEKTDSILASGQYITGSELVKFEKAFAQYCGTKYAVGVSNGTSALYLILKSLNLSSDDEVLTVSNSFIATGSAVVLSGSKLRFIDIGTDLNMDPKQLISAITPRTKVIMPVHLTGRIAPMHEILQIAQEHNLTVIEDAAQAVGAKLGNQVAGNFGYAAGFSLHPLKNLHAFGDAGIITTNNEKLYNWLKQARSHGLKGRACCTFWSANDRLDELQAGYLNIQLQYLNEWTQERREIARFYNSSLKDIVKVPHEAENEHHVYQTYMIQADRRDELLQYLHQNGIDAKIHYPIPIHKQPCYTNLYGTGYHLANTEKLASKIVSLPLYPGLCQAKQDKLITTIRKFYAS